MKTPVSTAAASTFDNAFLDGLKAHLADYLTKAHGIDTKKAFTCLNPEHPDKHPSMHLDMRHNKAHCFACGVNYDIFDVIGIDFGLTAFPDCVKTACEQTGTPFPERANAGTRPPVSSSPKTKALPSPEASREPKQAIQKEPEHDYTAYLAEARKNLDKTDYFALRGIGRATAARLGCGFDANFQNSGKGFVLLPSDGGGFAARNTNPNDTDRYRNASGISAALFNSAVLDTSETPVFVVEGAFDALSFEEAGAHAVALLSTSNTALLIERCKRIPPRVPLVLALDNDSAGRKAAEELAAALPKLGLSVYRVPDYPYKDANKYLCTDRDGFRKSVVAWLSLPHTSEPIKTQEQEAYNAQNMAAYLPTLLTAIRDKRFAKPLSTGFKSLDRAFDGGLYTGLYILGAISSLGKTTFCMQMVDALCASGQDVLVFSLEMSKTELAAKSISRLVMSNGGAITSREFLRGDEKDACTPDCLRTAIKAYGKLGRHLFIPQRFAALTAENIREAVERHVSLTGRKPVVLVDYLQILAPLDARLTEKQNTDRAVLILKQIAEKYDVPVLAISSFNRDNYTKPVCMQSFKESGGVEYSSDVLIGLQFAGIGESGFDIDAAKKENPRNIEAVILKNRFGECGSKISFEYNAAYNCFREKCAG